MRRHSFQIRHFFPCTLLILIVTSTISSPAHANELATSRASASTCMHNRDCTKKFTTCIGRRCMPLSGPQKACDDPADCKPSTGASRCIEGRCTPPSPAGGTCADYLDDGDCMPGLVCVNEKCTPPRGLGGRCVRFWHCTDNLVCINQKCAKKSIPGGKCDNSPDCAGSICIAGVCTEPVGAIVFRAISTVLILGVLVGLGVLFYRKF